MLSECMLVLVKRNGSDQERSKMKTELIQAKSEKAMKKRLELEAKRKQTNEATVVRQALDAYLPKEEEE